MKRREFITALGDCGGPLAGRAQQAVRRMGVLANTNWPPLEGLRQGLRKLGYIEGINLKIEYRFAQGRLDHYPALAWS